MKNMICINVTSQGESVSQSMDNQYDYANIKGDVSNFMNNSEKCLSNQFVL